MRIVDIERLMSDYLRSEGFRVVGSAPTDRQSKWVLVRSITDRDLTRPQYLVEYQVQLDCYAGAAGGQPEAIALALDVRESLEALAGDQPLGCVTATRFRGQVRLPDPSYEPARERVVIQAIVTAHPIAVAA